MFVRGSVVKVVAALGLLLSGLASVVVQATPAAAAVITVTSTAQENPFANNNQCTLGEAIQAANTNTAVDTCAAGSGASDTITLASAATYTLTAGPFDTGNGPDGLPPVTTPITILGNGSTITRSTNAIDGFRLMEVSPTGSLTLDNVALTNGNSGPPGGAIRTCGTLATQNGAAFSGNFAGAGGGAISDGDCPGGGSLATTITDTTFSGNSSSNPGGAVAVRQATITHSTFADNQSTADAGGAISAGGPFDISDSTFLRNHAEFGGGAIFLGSPSGQAVTVTRSLFQDNTENGVDGGGAIENLSQTLNVVDSSFVHNHGYWGGAIFARGSTTVTGSLFSNNIATDAGGAIFGWGAPTTTVTNSTFSGNNAFQFGAIFLLAGTFNLTNSTVAGSTSGGGVGRFDGTLTLTNTILDANVGGNCAAGLQPTDGGGNISFPDTDTSCAGAGWIRTDAKLGPLQNNGGPTQTMALLPGSSAIDAAVGTCPPPATDQRGVSRPQGAKCDIGAFEVAPVTINQAAGQADPSPTAPINFTVTFPLPVTGFTASDVTLGGTAPGTKSAIVTPTGPTTYNVAVSGMTGAGTVTASIGANVVNEGNPASTSTDNTVLFQNGDTTPPACAVVAVRRPGPSGHDEMDVRSTDTQSGLASITHIAITNGVASVTPSTPFAAGMTQATLTAIKTVQGQTTTFSFDVTDRAGNTRHCS